MKKNKQEIKSRVLTLTKTRGPEKAVSPSEVTRDLFSDVWKENVDEVRTTVGALQSEILISVCRENNELMVDQERGPIRNSSGQEEEK